MKIFRSKDFRRAAIHFPVGIIDAVIFQFIGQFAGVTFGFLFVFGYEALEDWRIQDRSYKDVLGFLWGLAIGLIVITILRTLIRAKSLGVLI